MAQPSQSNAKEERIAQVDAESPSPSKRAAAIYSILRKNANELTEWDLICFSVEYLGKMALLYPWLVEYVKPIARIVYAAHYLDDDTDTPTGIESEHTDSGETRSEKDSPRTLFTSDGP